MLRVLIVGASSGLGQALAHVYQEGGFSVEAVNRDRCDLSDPAAVTKLAESLAGPERWPDVCVFAAGTSEAGYTDEAGADAFRRCLEVNFLAPITLLRAMVRSTSCRRFVLVLSGTADLLLPGLSPYALSKRALRDYLEIVKLERSFPDCKILAVYPGAIATDFAGKTRIHGGYRPPTRRKARSARYVAEQIYGAQQSERDLLVLSPVPRLLGRLQAMVPGMIRWLIQRHPGLRRSQLERPRCDPELRAR